MILTNCAACAAPLAHDAPRCVRCHTRYCNKTCQGGLRQARARFALRDLLGHAVPGELAPPEPQLAAAVTPFAAASAIAGHLPGMDPQEANAAIEELSELKARDPEAFAELMQAALSGEGADAGDQDP